MDEFDIFRARAYGGYVEPSTTEDDVVNVGLNGNVENEWTRRESVSRRRRSVRKSGEAGESGRWADRSQSPGGVSSGERRGSSRSRINSQVTVAVEPPSPTECSREAHQRSHSWKARQVRLSPDCYDQEEEETPAVTSRYTTSSSSGLHRTRTMPARRSASPRQRSPAPSHPVIVEPSLDSPTSPDGSTEALGECKIYRVRSFTTKKGGIVNRGDSIKICNNSRRASRCDNLLVTPGGGSSRRNSTTSTGKGSLQPFQPSPLQLRRNSESCIDPPNPETHGAPTSPLARDSAERRPSQSSTRASCRNIAYDDHDEGVVELIPGRRASLIRLHGPGGETRVSTSNMPVNGASCPQRDVDLRVKVNGDDVCGEEEEEEEEGEEGVGGEEQVYNVMVVGSHGVGKTTLIHQLLTSEYLANKENYQGKDRLCIHPFAASIYSVAFWLCNLTTAGSHLLWKSPK